MIKNIVFDFGNVLVRWDPMTVLQRHFDSAQVHQLIQNIFLSNIWLEHNLGLTSLENVISHCSNIFEVPHDKLKAAIFDIKESLAPIPNSFDLLDALLNQGYSLYGLSDTSHEFLAHLKQQYELERKLRGIVASCEVGFLKPSPQIYQHLLNTHQLKAEETLFLDDLAKNIAGAQAIGMHGIQFSSVDQCIADMQKFNIQINL